METRHSCAASFLSFYEESKDDISWGTSQISIDGGALWFSEETDVDWEGDVVSSCRIENTAGVP
jgi:hypothetical protein